MPDKWRSDASSVAVRLLTGWMITALLESRMITALHEWWINTVLHDSWMCTAQVLDVNCPGRQLDVHCTSAGCELPSTTAGLVLYSTSVAWILLRVLRKTCSTPPTYPTIRNRTCKIKLVEHFLRYRMIQPLRIKQSARSQMCAVKLGLPCYTMSHAGMVLM
jgi:hypothetical protein